MKVGSTGPVRYSEDPCPAERLAPTLHEGIIDSRCRCREGRPDITSTLETGFSIAGTGGCDDVPNHVDRL